ncbi:MAG: tetraacyldisaccharide 4'-kinase [Candidatus Marinimicrobia bacterium]|nr:tetraacyldisaccharide 4'-kinase [Candidatus Neomarinimicrobiota bacterium]|tara:strand:+ start:2571 stop:3539 length:969 start_codon:yes stop_codon:yes gene_type:complete
MMILQLLINAVALLRNRLYKLNIISKQSFDVPVVSIGNIAMGGTGKTPMVVWLCQELMSSNIRPCVITRGYKRKSSDMIIVGPNEKNNYIVDDLGDEPFDLLKKLPGVSMVIHRNKSEAIKAATDVLDVDVIILDDGFQSLYINRDIDIALLNHKNKNMLNREPYHGLKRANVIVFNDGVNLSNFKSFINQTIGDHKILQLTMKKKPFINQKNKLSAPLLAVSGIANPNSFHSSLIDQKINVVKHLKYQDHHNYSKKDMNEIYQFMEKNECGGIITTSKDYYKLKKLNTKNIKIFRLDIFFVPVKDDIVKGNELINKIKNIL